MTEEGEAGFKGAKEPTTVATTSITLATLALAEPVFATTATAFTINTVALALTAPAFATATFAAFSTSITASAIASTTISITRAQSTHSAPSGPTASTVACTSSLPPPTSPFATAPYLPLPPPISPDLPLRYRPLLSRIAQDCSAPTRARSVTIRTTLRSPVHVLLSARAAADKAAADKAAEEEKNQTRARLESIRTTSCVMNGGPRGRSSRAALWACAWSGLRPPHHYAPRRQFALRISYIASWRLRSTSVFCLEITQHSRARSADLIISRDCVLGRESVDDSSLLRGVRQPLPLPLCRTPAPTRLSDAIPTPFPATDAAGNATCTRPSSP